MGMRAVKLCSNRILQFLTGGSGWHRLTSIMAIKWLLLFYLYHTAVVAQWFICCVWLLCVTLSNMPLSCDIWLGQWNIALCGSSNYSSCRGVDMSNMALISWYIKFCALQCIMEYHRHFVTGLFYLVVWKGAWEKLIKIGWWSGWWVGECFFSYRLTRVVPDKGQ